MRLRAMAMMRLGKKYEGWGRHINRQKERLRWLAISRENSGDHHQVHSPGGARDEWKTERASIKSWQWTKEIIDGWWITKQQPPTSSTRSPFAESISTTPRPFKAHLAYSWHSTFKETDNKLLIQNDLLIESSNSWGVVSYLSVSKGNFKGSRLTLTTRNIRNPCTFFLRRLAFERCCCCQENSMNYFENFKKWTKSRGECAAESSMSNDECYRSWLAMKLCCCRWVRWGYFCIQKNNLAHCYSFYTEVRWSRWVLMASQSLATHALFKRWVVLVCSRCRLTGTNECLFDSLYQSPDRLLLVVYFGVAIIVGRSIQRFVEEVEYWRPKRFVDGGEILFWNAFQGLFDIQLLYFISDVSVVDQGSLLMLLLGVLTHTRHSLGWVAVYLPCSCGWWINAFCFLFWW